LAGRHEAREARSLFANPILAAPLIIAVALATRCLSFGNPVIEMDDQFYYWSAANGGKDNGRSSTSGTVSPSVCL
jgi:hypothetical protein